MVSPIFMQINLDRFSCDRSIHLKALIISIVYRRWWYFRHTETQGAVPLSVLLRVILFTIFRIVVIVCVLRKIISYFNMWILILPSSTYGIALTSPPEENLDLVSPGFVTNTGLGDLPIWVDMLQAARMSGITVILSFQVTSAS
jgi:hypothetical protein